MKANTLPTRFEDDPNPGTRNAYAYELFQKGRQRQLYQSSENYLMAMELYTEAAALDPKFARPRIALSAISCAYYREYSKNQKWLRRAEASLAEAYRIAGESSQTLYARGMIEWLRGNVEIAERLLLQSIEMDSGFPGAYNILGNLYMSSGKYADAARIFLRELEVDESPARYYNVLSALDAAEETSLLKVTAERSIPSFDQYLAKTPNDKSTWHKRAMALMWAGRMEEAEKAADALSLRNDLPGIVIYNLGVLYEKLGKPELYVLNLRRAIEHGYREVEQTRRNRHIFKDPILLKEFDTLVATMQDLINREQALRNV